MDSPLRAGPGTDGQTIRIKLLCYSIMDECSSQKIRYPRGVFYAGEEMKINYGIQIVHMNKDRS